MGKHTKQRQAYDFLQSRIAQTFRISELAAAADWSPASAGTYVSKYLKGLLEKTGKGGKTESFRLRRDVRRITIEQYQGRADQTRRERPGFALKSPAFDFFETEAIRSIP